MCRLFGMSAGDAVVQATFWLLDAPDSLVTQSHQNADGTGVGYFDRDGTPHVDKQAIAAFEDRRFATEARDIWSRTYVSHVRHATTGGLTLANTHPFCQRDRLFARNGVIGDLAKLEQKLGAERALVVGQNALRVGAGRTPRQRLTRSAVTARGCTANRRAIVPSWWSPANEWMTTPRGARSAAGNFCTSARR